MMEYKILKNSDDKKIFLMENEQCYLILFESQKMDSKERFKNFDYYFLEKVEINIENETLFKDGEAAEFKKTIYGKDFAIRFFKTILEFKSEYKSLEKILKNLSWLFSSEIKNFNPSVIGFIGELIYIEDFLKRGFSELEFRKDGGILDFYEKETNTKYEIKITQKKYHQHHFSKNQIDKINDDFFIIFSIRIELVDDEKQTEKWKVFEILDKIQSYNNYEINNNISNYYADFISNNEIKNISFVLKNIKKFESSNYKNVCSYNNKFVEKIDIVLDLEN